MVLQCQIRPGRGGQDCSIQFGQVGAGQGEYAQQGQGQGRAGQIRARQGTNTSGLEVVNLHTIRKDLRHSDAKVPVLLETGITGHDRAGESSGETFQSLRLVTWS